MKKALIVDGQNNHAWCETMPVLMKAPIAQLNTAAASPCCSHSELTKRLE
jgi:hypothetical protein